MKINAVHRTEIMLMLVSISFFIQSQTANLVKNPGFETYGNEPDSWTITGPVASMQPAARIDTVISYNGNASLRMESSNPSCHGIAVQNVDITGGQTYEFKARLRAEHIVSLDRSILVRIKWFDDGNQVGYHYISQMGDVSNGWLLATDNVKAVKEANRAEISLVFRWGKGTVWWDDVSLEPCADIPARNIKVGTLYFRPPGPDVEKNIALMGNLLDEAGRAGCDIVCLPEGWPTCNTGLGMQKVEANSLQGSASLMLSEKAGKYKMYIVSGLYNWEGDTLKNVAALYNREGQIQAVYEKVQLPDSETEAGAVPGNSLPVFSTDFGKIGILICWDYAFPEISRILALNGAEILFCPIWGDIRGTDIWKITARSRAADNGVYFVTSIFDGHSVIINPAGDILAETGRQGTLIQATIDLNYNPPWFWLGNEGLGNWDGVWRKDRRSEVYGRIASFMTSPDMVSNDPGQKITKEQ